ncbi:MAG: hypothetical protein ACP5RC_07080 [Halothiobacillaceae bacterium]
MDGFFQRFLRGLLNASIAAIRRSHKVRLGLWEPRATATGSGVRQAALTAPLLALLLMLGTAAHAGLGIEAHLANPTPWLREEVLLTVEVLDDRSIIEQIIAPWTPPGVIVRPLGSRQERVQTPEGVRIRHRHLWGVMPLYPGPLTLQPPTVEARVSGGQRLPLIPPILRLEARPLDPLLPVDVPVSLLSLSALPLPEAVPRGRPFTWNLAVEGQGLSVRGIERWLKEALRDTGSLRVYPPDITLRDGIDPTQPLRQRVEVRLTLEPRTSGTITLPELVLPYLDPADGQLRLTRLEGGPVAVQHPLWLALRPWLPWFAGAMLLAAVVIPLQRCGRRWLARRAWLHSLREADTPAALRRAWRGGAETLVDVQTQALVQRLDAACYGNHPLGEADFRTLRQALLQAAAGAHTMACWPFHGARSR